MARTRAEARERWQGIVERQRASGLNGLAFCQQEGLSPKRFYVWRQRLEGAAPVEAPPVFLPVGLAGPARPSVEVVLGGEVQVRIPSGCDAGTIREVLSALRGRRC